MKKRLTWIWLSALFSTLPAAADVTVIAAPASLGAGPAQGLTSAELAALDRISRDPLVIRSEAVFDPGERKALSDMGEEALARSLKLTLLGSSDALRLADQVRHAGLPIKIESNPSALAMDSVAQEPLEPFQWGIRNTGRGQRIDIDDLTTIRIPGRAGEDAGLAGAPAESGSGKIVVAVLDTGVDSSHPDLQGQLLRKSSECDALEKYKACVKANGIGKCADLAKVDTDHDGYPLDCSGWNITAGLNPATGVFGSPDATDDAGHGTHVSGIVGAAINGMGVRGVAQNVRILPVKVIKTSPSQPVRPQSDDSDLPAPIERELRWSTGFADVIARGMLYAIRNHAQVINMSLAWPAGVDSILMRRMVTLAHGRGILVVSAAGNDSSDSRVFPCSYPEVICVASHNADGAFSHFSNYGSFVDVAAPGLGILSTWPTSRRSVNFTANVGYEIKNGTSMASPFVAGMLARLLDAGYSADEAYARLLIGARPTARSTGTGAEAANAKWTRSGNADLAASFKVTPRPLILSKDKSSVMLTWDLRAAEIPFGFALHNFWADATGVRIRATLSAPGAGTPGASLLTDAWDVSSMPAGSDRALSSRLRIDDPRIEGRILLELEISSDQQTAPRRVTIPMDLSVPVSPALANPALQSLPVRGGIIPAGAVLRSVGSLDGKPGHDYFAISGDRKPLLQLVTEVPGSHYEISAQAEAEPVNGSLLLIQRLDADQDGKSDYVFIFRMPPPEGKSIPVFRFQFFDRDLKPLTSMAPAGALDFDNGVSVINERFQWMRITSHGHDFLAPAWINVGTTPALDKPAPDPWDPNPQDPRKLRLYYLAPEGLHAMEPPKDSFFIQLLTPAPESAAGALGVMIGKGDFYVLDYSLASLDRGRLSTPVPLTLDHYHQLVGVENVIAATPLNAVSPASGTALSDVGTRGTQRTTALIGTSGGAPRETIDFTQSPASALDTVMQISGLFVGQSRRGAFAQTHYELQYNDLATGQVARTGLDRFSFLPAFIFARSFFPVVVGDPQGPGGDALPGMLIPASLGVSDSIEVVVPSYDSQGGLTGLSRPARLRLTGTERCQDLGNPVTDGPGKPTQLVYFCGDRFLRIPLINCSLSMGQPSQGVRLTGSQASRLPP